LYPGYGLGYELKAADMSRRVVLAGLLALAGTLGTVLVSCAAPAPDGWTGGPASPVPVRVTVNPSALPIGDAVATGVVVSGKEMILYLWGGRDLPDLGWAWRDTASGVVDEHDPVGGTVVDLVTPSFPGLTQLDAGDGTVVEFGAVRAPAARIVVAPPDRDPVEARYVRWSVDPGVVLFWLRRTGPPVSSGAPPGPPDRYPLVTAYDDGGRVVASVRIRPEPAQPLNDG
jgi:hypothetical protein